MAFPDTPSELLGKKGANVILSFHAAVRFHQITDAVFSPNMHKMVYAVFGSGVWLGGQLGKDMERMLLTTVTVDGMEFRVVMPIKDLGNGHYLIKTCLTEDHAHGNMQTGHKTYKWQN